MQAEEALGFSRPEGLDHKRILYCCTLYVNKKEKKEKIELLKVRAKLVKRLFNWGTTQWLHSTRTVNWVTTILPPTLNSPKMW